MRAAEALYGRRGTSPTSTYPRPSTPSNVTSNPSFPHHNAGLGPMTPSPSSSQLLSSQVDGAPVGHNGTGIHRQHTYAGLGGHLIPGHAPNSYSQNSSVSHPSSTVSTHPVSASTSSSSHHGTSSNSSAAFHPSQRSSPTSSETPEAVQTPPAHGSHFTRNPSAPSVASVTPIPPSIVHQYPPPEEVAPTLSPPRTRITNRSGYAFLGKEDQEGVGPESSGMPQISGQQDLQRADVDSNAMPDENGEELLKELDTFC